MRRNIQGCGRKIGVLGYGFIGWGGGLDFLRLILNGMLEAQANDSEVYLFIPQQDLWERARNLLGAAKGVVRSVLRGGKPVWRSTSNFSEQELRAAFADYAGKIELIFYSTSPQGLKRALAFKNIDVVIPVFGSLGKTFPIPWVGYIYDFQHRYFPDLFSKRERLSRDEWFLKVLNEASVVICNSRAVRDDAERFFPGAGKKIISLPFGAAPSNGWLDQNLTNIRVRYGLPEAYFMISNQFWIHKDHATAFRAMRKFLDSGVAPQGCVLACTGKMEDHRRPDYVDQLNALLDECDLRERIKFLGYISKSDQIGLMRGAIAVLQPTLFEGGPGGGAVFDAVAIGTPAIVSDLAVNREIEREDVMFFAAGNPDELAASMIKLVSTPVKRRPANELYLLGSMRLKSLGVCLITAMDRACELHNKTEDIY